MSNDQIPNIIFRTYRPAGDEIRTGIFIDDEGRAYRDTDPNGVQMSGKRTIIGTADVEIRWVYKDILQQVKEFINTREYSQALELIDKNI